MACVYLLIDPRTSDPFYVGVAERHRKRLIEHVRGDCPSTAERIKDIRAAGGWPKSEAVEAEAEGAEASPEAAN